MEEKKKILEILAELRPEFDFENSSDFIEDGLLDSFDIASLISTSSMRVTATTLVTVRRPSLWWVRRQNLIRLFRTWRALFSLVTM